MLVLQIKKRTHWLSALLAALLLAGCGPVPDRAAQMGPSPRLLPIATAAQPLPAQPCQGSFFYHALDHTTVIDSSPMLRMFETNGAGLAIDDLDNDGDLDLVLANLQAANSIFWNQGGLTFGKESLPHGDSRAVQLVDVDGDGWQDIVFTRRLSRPTLWRNLARPTSPSPPMQADAGSWGGASANFAQASLPGLYFPAYTMAWGDLGGDSALDLVTGSYDAALVQAQIANPHSPFGSSVGAYLYEHRGDAFVPLKLSQEAQALALVLADLDGDGQLDILQGNDFDQPDDTWLHSSAGWVAAAPFASTSRNTMSLDLGDIDNDGSPEIFSADMKPYDQRIGTLVAWLPMMQIMKRKVERPDGQLNENALQVRGADGRYHNQGYARGADATGWSWSSKFGDLDNDGFLDIYAVNGMVGEGIFDHLPNRELIEQNQALRNDGAGHFMRAPEWGLGSTASGRGMSMGDLDNDGDLDIVINNLGAPAAIFENRLCGGSSLEVDLRWPGSHNTRALGARLALHTSAGTYYRDVRSGSGYLSGDPARVHFGFPAGAVPQRLEIQWPDSRISVIDAPLARTLVTATR